MVLHRPTSHGRHRQRMHLLYLLILLESINCDVHPYKKQKPNIVLFLTDDQDVELGSLNFMPKTLKHIREEGTEFRHAYVTTPMCCPSRSSLLTGMYVHNHEVFTNKDNCSSAQWQATHETKSFATYLSNAGYRTGYFGKYLNKYNGSYIPPGWREWGGLIMNSKYYNYSLNMNGQTIKHGFDYDKDYYTDIIAKDAINFIRNSKKQYPNKPLMLVMAFPAPHGPEDSAPQYSNLYFNVTMHHTPSYNFAPNPDKQWILQVTGKMQSFHKDFTDLLMTKRLQTLQSVDDAVEEVINELRDLNELNKSFIVYTSDHGYHLGQFGLVKGKSFPFEFDVRVPFLVRGPGIQQGATKNEIVLNIDLAPTFLDIAGVKIPPQMDGRSILPLIFSNNRRRMKWPDTFLIESSGRRETPHLQTKKHETNLLHYSVPRNAKSRWNYSDLNNDLLIQLYKNLNPLEAIQKHLLFDGGNENFKNKSNDSGLHNYLNTNMIAQKVAAPNPEKGSQSAARAGRDTFRCFFETKFPCRNGQKWFCRLDNGRWHKYRCKEQNRPAGKDEKQCVCFTAEGPIFKTYWIKNKRPRLIHHKKQQKYCYCDHENEEQSKYEPTQEEKTRMRKQKKKEELCHHERMTCFEHNSDHWRTEPKWTGGSFCFCMNANNNTYSCLRTINLTHNFLYCEFTTGLVTFYNLRIDPFELQNRYEHLPAPEKSYLRNLLKNMVSCKGHNCTGHLDTSFRLNGLDEREILLIKNLILGYKLDLLNLISRASYKTSLIESTSSRGPNVFENPLNVNDNSRKFNDLTPEFSGNAMSVMREPSFATWAAQRAAGYGGNITVVDRVPPEMLFLVDSYWYQYPPLNPLWHSLLGFVIGVLAFTSIIGNGMVVYIFTSTKALRTPSNLLVVNLAFSDFLMMFCMAPPMVVNCYNETWVFGPLFCEIYGMFGSLFGCTSIWTMVFIALDRYNVIVKGLSAVPLTKKTAMLRILLIWTMSVGWTVAPVLGWNRYVPEGNMTVCGTDYLSKDLLSTSYIMAYAFWVYFLPLMLIIYAYWFIVQAVATHEKSMREQAKKMNVASLRSSESSQTSAECKLAKIALMTIFLWFMAWTPYLVTNFSGIFGNSKITPLATIWSSLFAKANAVYNPIVYGISHPKYRQALQKKFPSLVCAGQHADDATSQASGVTNVASDDKSGA